MFTLVTQLIVYIMKSWTSHELHLVESINFNLNLYS